MSKSITNQLASNTDIVSASSDGPPPTPPYVGGMRHDKKKRHVLLYIWHFIQTTVNSRILTFEIYQFSTHITQNTILL